MKELRTTIFVVDIGVLDPASQREDINESTTNYELFLGYYWFALSLLVCQNSAQCIYRYHHHHLQPLHHHPSPHLLCCMKGFANFGRVY